MARGGGAPSSVLEPGHDGLDDLVEYEPAAEVQVRREADLGVHHSLSGQILGALSGHAMQGFFGLHHRVRMPERGQVLHE